jgi:hypothetical protein
MQHSLFSSQHSDYTVVNGQQFMAAGMRRPHPFQKNQPFNY